MNSYTMPDNLEDAFAILSAGDVRVLSGGTDFFPSYGQKAPSGNVLDISRISSIKPIATTTHGDIEIGALATWSDLIKTDLPPAFDGLKLAAREVGSIQIQNRATLVGNICNASPAADGVPPLLSLNASVRIGSARGYRTLPLELFIEGNRKTNLANDELVVGITIPASATEGLSGFLKLGARKYLVISIAMVAVRLTFDDKNNVREAYVSVGACSEVAMRLAGLERRLVSCHRDQVSNFDVQFDDISMLSPIDDVRSTRDYRLAASCELVRRTLAQVVEEVR